MPNIDDVARWLASPPEEMPEIGVYQGGGSQAEGTGENNFTNAQEEIKSPVMAKVLKVSRQTRFKSVICTHHSSAKTTDLFLSRRSFEDTKHPISGL